ncbi:MAG: hypothetical protein R3F54_24270 [Alphaproteobacteria bacterium]
MHRTWSAIVVAVAGGFVLAAFAFDDLRTPNAVVWQPTAEAGRGLEHAHGLVLQEAKDGVLWASDGFSIYRSEGDRGFLKVHAVTPPLDLSWIAYSRTLRRLLGFEEAIEVFSISPSVLLVFVGGEIQRVDLETGSTEVVHRLRYFGKGEGRGVMPFGITVDGEGRVYYGEYVTRHLVEGETVALYRSDDGGRSFEIVYEFQPLVVRHIHAVQWDPYADVLWMGTGDGDEQSRVGFSKDHGETFLWVGQDSQDFRTVNFAFSETHVDWLSDTVEPAARALRWQRANWGIETSPEALPGHGHYLQPIGDGYSVGTTAEEAVSLWLVGPELGLNKIMEWPLGEPGRGAFPTVRLARGQPETDDWLYFSPLRVRDGEPAIYRLRRPVAFAAAGVDMPGGNRQFTRDDP